MFRYSYPFLGPVSLEICLKYQGETVSRDYSNLEHQAFGLGGGSSLAVTVSTKPQVL
jgi:hypothetical protein